MTYKNLEEYGRYLRKKKDVLYSDRAIVVYSILDMMEATKMDAQNIHMVINEIAAHLRLDYKDLLKVLIHLLSDTTYFATTQKEFKRLFETPKPQFEI